MPSRPEDRKRNLDSEFYVYSIKDYKEFMTNPEYSKKSEENEEEFFEKIKDIYLEENDEIEQYKNQIELLDNDLQGLRLKFENADSLELQKKQLQQEIYKENEQIRQTLNEKLKHEQLIPESNKKLEEIQLRIDILKKEKNELKEKVSNQK